MWGEDLPGMNSTGVGSRRGRGSWSYLSTPTIDRKLSITCFRAIFRVHFGWTMWAHVTTQTSVTSLWRVCTLWVCNSVATRCQVFLVTSTQHNRRHRNSARNISIALSSCNEWLPHGFDNRL